MHNNINNIDKDLFSEALRKKLDNHSMPIDVGSWDAIRAGMKAQKRKKLLPLWWTSAGAAAVILLLISLRIFNNSPEIITQLAVNKEVEIQSETKAQVEEVKENALETIEIENTKPTIVSNNKKHLLKNKTSKPDLANNYNSEFSNTEKNVLVDETIAYNQSEDSIWLADNRIVNEEKEQIKSIENKVTEKQQKVLNTKALEISSDWEDPLKNKNNRDWALLASVGSSEGIESNIFLAPTTSMSNQFASIVKAPRRKANATLLTPNDFPTKIFHAPLSVGLAASKSISNRLSLQTGLVYTYLLTDFQATNRSARLNLHYLGVPLNLNVQLWRNNKWSVYTSAGVMVEKGLQSVFVQLDSPGSQLIKTSVSTKIDGFQWSIQAASGITYNIYKEFDLYLEPKISYHFDNDQPVSSRTDKAVAIGFGAGFKFRF